MDRDEERRYERLSPFELKNRLLELAAHRGEKMMLNAGRGNPDWVALEPREAFVLLQAFALAESRAAAGDTRFGGLPRKRGIAARLRAFLAAQPRSAGGDPRGHGGGLPPRGGKPLAHGRDLLAHTRDPPSPGNGPVLHGHDLLTGGIDLASTRFGFDPDLLVGEWVDGVLGDHYPVPVRMLRHAETLVRAHLAALLFGGDPASGDFELFAVEGASAGIAYVFQTLLRSGLLARGDRIALGVPIFTPYLEIPHLPEHAFEVVEVMQDEAAGWRYPAAEIDKLRDPRIKAFLAVNPSNPTAVAMEPETVARLARIVDARPDLILITDDVYAPFVEGFRSLAAAAPRNTILLYSFSKFWGATGLRLGVVGLHARNALDPVLASAPAGSALRYRTLATEPQRLKLIDRIVADSRAVGMNHTAGLSTPQQVQMALFAIDALLDAGGTRARAARALLRERSARLHRGAGLEPSADARCTHYYATLDIPRIARRRHGDVFADWLVASFEPIDFVVRLAEERGIVLLDGGGFDAPRMSVRVSLANLPGEACEGAGRGIAALLEDYHARWRAQRGGRP